ncbi:hypothetical protein SAY87_001403 [Trapa incisa]|uniref:Uncharacterized protein n=1 Tax=Trapa incisa TaxID=236973 RepID=A0AAN7GPH5_9MYRT|nr:hypothetical protein SAY87_001403 [Trapa incisa]
MSFYSSPVDCGSSCLRSDHHGQPKVNCWQDPMSPSKWKEEHFVIVSLSGWGLLIFGGYKFFTGGKDKKGELREVSGLRKSGDYIEVTCGHRCSYAVGRLGDFVNGDLQITCKCTPGCHEVLTFMHVQCKKLLGNQTSKKVNGSQRSNIKIVHSDEFVRCSRCKERRFHLRTKKECRVHHDTLADVNWKCADLPYDKSVGSQIAAARLAWTSLEMPKLLIDFCLCQFYPLYPIFFYFSRLSWIHFQG